MKEIVVCLCQNVQVPWKKLVVSWLHQKLSKSVVLFPIAILHSCVVGCKMVPKQLQKLAVIVQHAQEGLQLRNIVRGRCIYNCSNFFLSWVETTLGYLVSQVIHLGKQKCTLILFKCTPACSRQLKTVCKSFRCLTSVSPVTKMLSK